MNVIPVLDKYALIGMDGIALFVGLGSVKSTAALRKKYFTFTTFARSPRSALNTKSTPLLTFAQFARTAMQSSTTVHRHIASRKSKLS